jgi:hypothetical protein
MIVARAPSRCRGCGSPRERTCWRRVRVSWARHPSVLEYGRHADPRVTERGEPDRVAIAASQAAMRGSKSGSSPAPAFRSERSDAIAPMSPVAATRTTTSGSSEAMAHRCSRPARRCPGDRQGAPSYGASFGWHQRAALAPAPRLASGCFLGALSGRAASNVELAATLRRGHARCSPAPVGSVHASQS